MYLRGCSRTSCRSIEAQQLATKRMAWTIMIDGIIGLISYTQPVGANVSLDAWLACSTSDRLVPKLGPARRDRVLLHLLRGSQSSVGSTLTRRARGYRYGRLSLQSSCATPAVVEQMARKPRNTFLIMPSSISQVYTSPTSFDRHC